MQRCAVTKRGSRGVWEEHHTGWEHERWHTAAAVTCREGADGGVTWIVKGVWGNLHFEI